MDTIENKVLRFIIEKINQGYSKETLDEIICKYINKKKFNDIYSLALDCVDFKNAIETKSNKMLY